MKSTEREWVDQLLKLSSARPRLLPASLPGMLQTYEELLTRDQSVFVIGPGNHGGQPDREIKGSYTRDYADTLAWLDHHLREAPLPDHLRPGVNVFVHGDNSWRHFDRWSQQPRSLTYHLSNLAHAQACDGGELSTEISTSEEVARYAHDPRKPVPTRGGAFQLMSDAGAEQSNDICERADVLSFLSAPFAADTSQARSLLEHQADACQLR